jgi:arginine-tRNA-protein transferase
MQGFFARRVPPAFYRQLLDHGFRRSGTFFYHPHCANCSECRPLRVPVASFHPSRSQRRCFKHNQDLALAIAPPELTEEKFELYQRYQREKHGHVAEKDMGALRFFLYNSPVDSLEFCYRDPAGKLLAVSICDLFSDALSSVYAYYAPECRRRGLGTYTALKELEYAGRQALAYYYLGYYVQECQAMSYKASFRPCELLDATQGWRGGVVEASAS